MLSLLGIAVSGTAWTTGRAVHERRVFATEALQQITTAAVTDERFRIARELHDIVAHHISSISVQAETARLTVPGMPPDGAARLRAIGDTARQSLTEMRRLLGVLREDTPAPALALAPPPPQPGLDRLIALVDEAARATTGSGVRLVIRGPVRRLAPGLELTAYRIVQEALTNARRHAPGAPVEVELRYTPGSLHITIRDTGASRPPESCAVAPDLASPRGLASPRTPGPSDVFRGRVGGAVSALRRLPRALRSATDPTPPYPATPPGADSPAVVLGHGLLGMRERVAMAGGVLRAAPGPVGGFLVTATLPISHASAAPPSLHPSPVAAGIAASAAAERGR